MMRAFARLMASWLVCLTVAPGSAAAQTLTGAIDMHAHGDPDGTARKIDVIERLA